MATRSLCFTLNNHTAVEVAHLATMPGLIRFICWGVEIAASGTPHLQGYLELSKPCRLAAIKKLGPGFDRAHFEARRGKRDDARDYCAKGSQPHDEWKELKTKGPNYGLLAEFISYGDWEAGGQGCRPDLGKVRSLACAEGMRGVTLTCNMQQIRVAEKFLSYHEEGRTWKPSVMWLWGPTGTGKTQCAHWLLGGLDFFVKSNGTKWWDGYDGHEGVIIDDFRDSWWELTETLGLLDRYTKPVETKGGWRQFLPKVIVVTSAKSPEACYASSGEDLGQLLRRIDVVTKFRNEVGGGNTGAPPTFLGYASPTPLEASPLVVTDDDLDDLLAELASSAVVSSRK